MLEKPHAVAGVHFVDGRSCPRVLGLGQKSLHVRKSLLFFIQARHVPAVESSSLRGAHCALMRGEGVCVQGVV